MLEAVLGTARMPLAADDYLLTRAYNGQDTVRVTLSRRDPAAAVLAERVRVYETTTGQTFWISGIDAGQETVTYAMKKDLTDWQRQVYLGYTNGSTSATALSTLQGVLPEGWSIVSRETDSKMAYITLQGPTALEVAEQCMEVYGCALTFDNRTKQVTVHYPAQKVLGTAFFVETANLRQAPEYKSQAADLVTRLYPQGADGVGISSVNGGKAYVECYDYTDEVVAGLWVDERYTIPAHLLTAAQEKVRELAQPDRSWSLDVCDLYSIDSESWPGLKLELYGVVKLIDKTLGHQMEAQITELRCYPHHPERNGVSVTNVAGSLRPRWRYRNQT